MTYVTAYNPNETPLVVDDEGRTIDGLAWGAVDKSSTRGRRALELGHLVEVDASSLEADGANPLAAKAHARTKAAGERSSSLSELDKDNLLEAARTAELITAEDEPTKGEPTKGELVSMLAHRPDITVPAPRRRPTKAASTDPQEA